MQEIDHEYHAKYADVFLYKGTEYHIAKEGGILKAIDKKELPQTLCRVVSDHNIKFDSGEVLLPSNRDATNDMVSMAYPTEWQKFARIFYTGLDFKLITVDTSKLIGPQFVSGNRILLNGEILSLVPKESILKIEDYIWTKAEKDFDYGERYYEGYDLDFYKRLVLGRSRGLKPVVKTAND